MSERQHLASAPNDISGMAGGTAVPLVMKAISPGQIWLAIEPVDMRVGIDGLSTRVQQALNKSPADGSAYVFRNRRCTRLKLLVWDSTGVL